MEEAEVTVAALDGPLTWPGVRKGFEDRVASSDP